MFERDRDPVRIPFEPISPAFEPGLELVGCSCKPPEEAFAARMIRKNQDAISHKASRFRLGPQFPKKGPPFVSAKVSLLCAT